MRIFLRVEQRAHRTRCRERSEVLAPAATAIYCGGTSDVIRLLDTAAAGDRKAADLLPLVYDKLRRLADVRMTAEAADHTLQPTALVNEAYLRLVGSADARRWDHRGHFFAAAETGREVMTGDEFMGRLRRAVRAVLREFPEMNTARVSLTC